jgi:hypothetical protein
MSDLSNFGRPPVTPFNQAIRCQRVKITSVDDTDYRFIVEDFDPTKAFGPAPGPAGMAVGDIVYAIPVVQGGWILIDPTRIVLS